MSEDKELWMTRAAACELLALSLRYPTDELARILASGEWADAAREIAAALGAELSEDAVKGRFRARAPKKSFANCAPKRPTCSSARRILPVLRMRAYGARRRMGCSRLCSLTLALWKSSAIVMLAAWEVPTARTSRSIMWRRSSSCLRYWLYVPPARLSRLKGRAGLCPTPNFPEAPLRPPTISSLRITCLHRRPISLSVFSPRLVFRSTAAWRVFCPRFLPPRAEFVSLDLAELDILSSRSFVSSRFPLISRFCP